jgi:hypothetical protein
MSSGGIASLAAGAAKSVTGIDPESVDNFGLTAARRTSIAASFYGRM